MEYKNFLTNKWEEYGLLANTPEERKDKVIEILNYSVEFLTNININTSSITRESDGMTLTTDDLRIVEVMFPPIILRIVNEVDISKEDVRNMYNHMQFDFFDFMKKYTEYPNIDWELEYACQYAKNEILKRQTNNFI